MAFAAMIQNPLPRYEILSGDSMEALDRGWRRIVTELGIEFTMDEAVEEFRKAGPAGRGQVVKLDPEFVLEQVAKAPREFDAAGPESRAQRPHRRRQHGLLGGLRAAVRARGRRAARRGR